MAIKYHNYIKKGYATLHYQKFFVSSLHNAVELFLKQIMLDTNDYEVATVRRLDSADSIELMRKYLNATDLNVFFATIMRTNPSQINNFSSVEFNILKQKASKLVACSNIGQAMQILQELRNNETHFAILGTELLNETNFRILHNFMVDFFKVLRQKELLPTYMIDFGSDKVVFGNENECLAFNDKIMNTFSYKKAVKDNELSKKIKDIVMNHPEINYLEPQPDLYRMARYIAINGDFINNFDEVYTLLLMMYNLNLVEFTEKECELSEDLQDKGFFSDCYFGLKFNY